MIPTIEITSPITYSNTTIFQQIQYIKERLSSVKNIPHYREHPDFPLRRFVLCVCNQPFTGSWQRGRGKRYPYYRCNNRTCGHYGRNVKKEGLEEKFIAFLEKNNSAREVFETL